ncbi:MAG: tetratricopeptide repeat protein, partial [Thermoplasmata archaeon]
VSMISNSLNKNENDDSSVPSDTDLKLQDLRISKEKLKRMAKSQELGSEVIQAYRLLLDGELDKSLKTFEEVLEDERDIPVAWYGKGLISLLTNDLDAAVQFFEKAISLKPDFKDAIYEKGVALHEMGRTKEALEHWKRSREEERSY